MGEASREALPLQALALDLVGVGVLSLELVPVGMALEGEEGVEGVEPYGVGAGRGGSLESVVGVAGAYGVWSSQVGGWVGCKGTTGGEGMEAAWSVGTWEA